VCELSGVSKDCVDQGPPVCDNDQREACEVCEIDDETACPGLGMRFSGGTAICNSTCDGWDTSACFVCGNDQQQGREQCDGTDTSRSHTCADEGIQRDPNTVLPCTDECVFDTTYCGGCSPNAATCLEGEDCAGADCNGTECKLGHICSIDCSGARVWCDSVRCNHDATLQLQLQRQRHLYEADVRHRRDL
jgi:hypothetical protein